MKVVILAGGKGTRLREETEFRPKPMVAVGSQPILWHIMKSYSFYGFDDFVICVGYKGEQIKQYFLNYEFLNSDFTLSLDSYKKTILHDSHNEKNWNVTIADTGHDTLTASRILKAKKYIGDNTFLCTYGDGLANIDISSVVNFHKSHGKVATLCTVQPQSRFGILNLNEDGVVTSFKEKPEESEWINAGFFVFEPEIFDYLNENTMLESQPLQKLASEGNLMGYKHDGFWHPMDTYRDSQHLNDLWNEQNAPWKVW